MTTTLESRTLARAVRTVEALAAAQSESDPLLERVHAEALREQMWAWRVVREGAGR